MSGREAFDPAIVLTTARHTLDGLGLDYTTQLDKLEAFLNGPPVCAVTGRSKRGVELICKKISTNRQWSLMQASVDQVSPAFLADVVVLATPAHSALARNESETLARLKKAGRPIKLVVTELESMGDDTEQKVAIKEIENLRLQREIKPLGIDWLFWRNDNADSINEFLQTFSHLPKDRLHAGAFNDALAQILGQAKTAMQEAEDQRTKAAQGLKNIDMLYGKAATHIHHVATNARLVVRDRLRDWRMNFDSAAQSTAVGLSGWISRNGLGEIDDALIPLVDSWRTFTSELDEVLSLPARRYQEEATAMHRKLDSMAQSIGIETQAEAEINIDWLSDKTREAADQLRESDMQVVLDAAKTEARDCLKQPERKESEEAESDTKQTKEEWRTRLQIKLDEIQGKAPQARIETILFHAIETIIGPRMERLIDSVSEDVSNKTPVINEAFVTEYKKRIDALRMDFDQAYGWQGMYSELLALIDSVDKQRRGR
ncbi:hypothetical protein [Desulfatirhabdium butyrativorans]|uniref:hypothetical protein n=1 Tax=Desulfatirhabdium butyrativorans TaxID=340467 RepID=UPI00040723D7|nr:hypothetical protein [Desulfatirhabdium butyrativorans]